MTGEIIMPAHQEIRLPDFAEKRKLSSAEMGTAMHTFMEEADFRKKYTREEIDSLTAELVQRGRLKKENIFGEGSFCNFSSPNWRNGCVGLRG